MAKRLSSLFSSGRVDSAPHLLQRPASPTQTSFDGPDLDKLDTMKPTLHKLQKPYNVNSSSPEEGFCEAPPSPLAPPPMLGDFGRVRSNVRDNANSRPGSRDSSRSRPQTPVTLAPNSRPDSPATQGRLKRRGNITQGKVEPEAWIAGVSGYHPYMPDALFRGERLTELWFEHGDVEISLFPRSYRYLPAIRVDSKLLADSAVFRDLLRNVPHAQPDQMYTGLDAQFHRMSMRSPVDGTQYPYSSFERPNFSMPSAYGQSQNLRRIYLDLEFKNKDPSPNAELHPDDQELLILYRNFLCFLFGGALVATPRQSHLYNIFLGISTVLKKFQFSNHDGSTWGNVPSASFDGYIEELQLADVRASREKAVEALVLGERMKSWALYVEGFTHVVARFEDIKSLAVPSFSNISGITLNRLERCHLDLEQRLLVLQSKLREFDFPFMFSGVANSATSFEAKQVRFKAWKASFIDFKKRTVAYYQRKYGQWPPNAKSKKNRFEVSGLNRQVLRELYQDFCDLYDILVDRSSITPRMTEQTAAADRTVVDAFESTLHALRRVENEYDMSTPPVMPAIPYDTPHLPNLRRCGNAEESNKNMMGVSRRLKENEVNEVLFRACNRDLLKGSVWIQDFLTYERQMASGKTIEEMIDLRCGQWLFVYAVIQSLPMTVMDGKDLKFTEGVEYFLCMPPRGGRPWMRDEINKSKTWYNVSGGPGVMAQPADVIDHSAEGVYRRSHCWKAAEIWSGVDFPSPSVPYPLANPSAPSQQQLRRLTPPRLSPHPSPMIRPLSQQDLAEHFRQNDSRRGSNVGLGGEPLSLQGESHSSNSSSRPVSQHLNNPEITFDSILGSTADPKAGKKVKKK